MGLADMMSPGESKLPLPLKADGKEEGTAQPESKSKVFLSPLHAVWGLLAAAAVWLSPHFFSFGLFSSACLHLVRNVCSLLSPPPSWCGSESY